jgi:hypothetical protein
MHWKWKCTGLTWQELFLTWLTRWVVSQTTNSLDHGGGVSTFGSVAVKHASQQLDARTKLVTAGNSYVPLSVSRGDNRGEAPIVTIDRDRDLSIGTSAWGR